MSERFVKTQSGIITNKLLAGDTGNSIVGLLQIYLCSVDSKYRYLHLNTYVKLYLHISNEHSLIKAVCSVVSIIDMITS